MSATNKTAVYELPIFLGTDVPSWLTDWNGAMGDIDTAIAAAKAAADAAASTAGTAATDIVTINGQITSLQNTVGTHTTQIGTISGNINTINSLIGNGTPTTTDQTLIGAINELHANQGDLTDLTTTDKSSLVAAINEAAQSGGGGTPETVEVTADGVKTISALMDELFALIDFTKLKSTSTLARTVSANEKDVFTLSIVRSNQVVFSRLYVDGTTKTRCESCELKSSGSVRSYFDLTPPSTIAGSDISSTVMASGIKLIITY